jgi:hypothetical protein
MSNTSEISIFKYSDCIHGIALDFDIIKISATRKRDINKIIGDLVVLSNNGRIV